MHAGHFWQVKARVQSRAPLPPKPPENLMTGASRGFAALPSVLGTPRAAEAHRPARRRHVARPSGKAALHGGRRQPLGATDAKCHPGLCRACVSLRGMVFWIWARPNRAPPRNARGVSSRGRFANFGAKGGGLGVMEVRIRGRCPRVFSALLGRSVVCSSRNRRSVGWAP